jgi:cathepsin L
MFLLCNFVASALIHDHEERSFVAHMRQYGLSYTGDEYQFRLGLYLSRAQLVREHNSGSSSFTVELNRFATLTSAESASLRGYRSMGHVEGHELRLKSATDVPDEFDWRPMGVVQAVKDQGKCGGCWTFAAVAAQESAWAIKTGTLTSLSEQNLVDCVTTCYGCNGGNVELAYYYVLRKQGGHFNTEKNYPYQAITSTCRFQSSDALTAIADWGLVSRSEASLQEVISTYGPTAVAIDASHISFQLYRSGIYNEKSCSSTNLDHAVTAVGYGTSPSAYWLVKNSWGTSWGEKGYIRMTRNVNNQCGIATEAVVPFAP